MRGVLLLVLALFAGVSSAQLYSSRFTLPQLVAMRLADHGVRRVLGLSEAQSESVDRIFASYGQDQSRLTSLPGQHDPARQKKIEELDVSTVKDLCGVLSAPQLSRLRELAIQETGPFALRDREVAKFVGITADQAKKIEDIAARTRAQLNTLSEQIGDQIDKTPQGKAGDVKRAAISKSYTEMLFQIEAKGGKEVLALLTKSQAAQWAVVKGKPFKL